MKEYIKQNMNAGRKKDTRSSKRTVKKWDNNTPDYNYFKELMRVSKKSNYMGCKSYD